MGYCNVNKMPDQHPEVPGKYFPDQAICVLQEHGRVLYCILCAVFTYSRLRWYHTSAFLFAAVGNILIYYFFLAFVAFSLPFVGFFYFLLSTSLMAHRKVLDISGDKVQAPH